MRVVSREIPRGKIRLKWNLFLF